MLHYMEIVSGYKDSQTKYANEVQTNKINVDHTHMHMKSYVHCIYIPYET